MKHNHVVLLKSGSSLKGGLEGYTNRLIKAFRMRGHFVTLLTSGPINPSADYNQVSLCPQSKISYFHLRTFDKACKKWFSENHSDIVFGMDRNSYQTHYRAGNGVHAAYLQRRSQDEGFFKSFSFRINPLHQSILSLEKKTYESTSIRKIFTMRPTQKKLRRSITVLISMNLNMPLMHPLTIVAHHISFYSLVMVGIAKVFPTF
jgi:hypothetical protein